MGDITESMQQKPAPIDSVPVLPYSVIDGQLDQSDPVWLGRISAAVIVFLVAIAVAIFDDTWQAMRQYAGFDRVFSTYYFTMMLQGGRLSVFAAGCVLIASRERSRAVLPRGKWWQLLIPWLAAGSVCLYFTPYLVAGYLEWLNSGGGWVVVASASAGGTVVAGILAGIILLEIARRIPNLVLARQVLAAMVLLAIIMVVNILVNFAPLLGGSGLSLQRNLPLARILAFGAIGIDLFVAFVLVKLLIAINAAADTVRAAGVRDGAH